MEQRQQYQLGPWKICLRTNTISDNVGSHAIDNKSMQLLQFLIEHQGQTVTKEQIFKHIWKDKFVTDDILSVTVSKIRKALGDNARSPTFIKTLPGVGYVLIANAKKVGEPEETNINRSSIPYLYTALLVLLAAGLLLFFTNSDEPEPSNPLSINSIAVLPFDDLSEGKDNQYFADGVSDAIINQLSQIKSLKVISRYSSFTYRGEYNATQIGQALQVDTLLDGSLQKSGDQLRINVRIFNTKNGQQLWSKTFDGESHGMFELQDVISGNIQSIIQPGIRNVSSPTRSINAQAFEWYLMGQYHWRQRNPESLAKAVTYFKRSLEVEPNFADAHVGLGITYELLHIYGNWDEKRSVDAALPHLNKALTLQPDSPTALAAKGLVLTEKAVYMSNSGQEDLSLYQQAQNAFLRSLELDDNATTHQWYSGLLRRIGSESEVIYHLNKAIELNPLSASLKRSFAFELLSMGNFDSAQKMFHSGLTLEPDYFSKNVESSRINRYSRKSILSMSAWHKQNTELFETCASDEYCEHLVFNYLSIGAKDLANSILANMGPKHFHFRTSLNAISAVQSGDEQSALRIIERFALWQTGNRRARFDCAIAQYRAGKFEQAQATLLYLYPNWGNSHSITHMDISPNNYRQMLLYAATLSSLQQQDIAERLFEDLLFFLNREEIFDKTEAEFTRSEIHAQMGNKQQALTHLASALKMGWMETYSKEWWSLANNHLLQPLYDEVEFQQLLTQHQVKRKALRGVVIRNFNTESKGVD
ncbi:winged helix-turn-helix domain-containing protein [Aliiglaciecola sp. M165]|uniref:winged helix-turn-helix domain-containing protein n=1 Tax=Aliiglaciecola sp. M165 TaxID=2593649 RepID=UPI001180749A|nr:winged helix-turn-helix domain-containing protein [Aliiglaciecola sp. M165]TRY33755.1 hypothetical protein FM019_00380 [Aliiglaciecola sp. M165]